MKKIIILAICFLGLSPLAKAQMLNLNYQISLPLNQVKDFTDRASFRGFDIEYHQFLGEKVSVGASIGWDVYYKDKDHATGNFSFKGSNNIYTITGNQYRYINFVPMLAVGRYYFTDKSSAVRPYIGLGLGTSWTERRLEVGQFSSTISRWQFAMAPEAGMYIPVSDQFAFNLGARYYYATKAAHGRVPEIQQVSFNFGIILMSLN